MNKKSVQLINGNKRPLAVAVNRAIHERLPVLTAGVLACGLMMSTQTMALDISDLDGANGFFISETVGINGSTTFRNIGDVNGDGIDDLAIASGNTHIVFGKAVSLAHQFEQIDLNALDGKNGFSTSQGLRITEALDINGDDINDIVFSDTDSRKIHVLYGKDISTSSNFESLVNATDITGEAGFVINDIDSDGFRGGQFARTSGDLNGDGVDDLMIHRYKRIDYSYGDYAEQEIIIFGKSSLNGDLFPSSFSYLDLAKVGGVTIKWTDGFDYASAEFIDDHFIYLFDGKNGVNFNGNNKDDLVFEYDDGLIELVELPDLDAGLNTIDLGDLNHHLDTIVQGDFSTVGDINGDGLSDILTHDSFSYTLDIILTLGQESGSQSTRIRFVDGEYGNIHSIGDINGDGFSDISMSRNDSSYYHQYYFSPNETTKSFIFYGSDELSALSGEVFMEPLQDPSNITTISHGNIYKYVGDINGDGIDDLFLQSNIDETVCRFAFGQREYRSDIDFDNLAHIDYEITNCNQASPIGDVNADGATDLIVNGLDRWNIVYGPKDTSHNGALGDYVWNDINSNGKQDGNEPGLANINVQLQTCTGEKRQVTTTDANGRFVFDHLAPGNYRMQFMRPSNFIFSPEKSAGNYQLDSNSNVNTGLTQCYSIADGQQRLAIDAGMIPVAAPSGTAVLGDYVWSDINGNGKQDSNESGLANVSIDLQTCDGSHLDSTTTNANGNFAFANLVEGSYQMQFHLLTGYQFSPEKSAGNYRLDSNAKPATGLTPCYAMADNQERLAIDAGMVPGDISSPDTVNLVKGIYFTASKKLWLRAESDATPAGSADITATMVVNGIETDLGQIGWKADKGFYQQVFKNISVQPDSIIISSDQGGTATGVIEVR